MFAINIHVVFVCLLGTISLEKNGKGIETVTIERIDRLAPDLMVQETILSGMNQSGVSVLSATDGDLLEDDPTRKLVRQVLGAIAEYDKTMTVQKLKALRDRKRARDGKCEGRLAAKAELVQAVVEAIHKEPEAIDLPEIKRQLEKLKGTVDENLQTDLDGDQRH